MASNKLGGRGGVGRSAVSAAARQRTGQCKCFPFMLPNVHPPTARPGATADSPWPTIILKLGSAKMLLLTSAIHFLNTTVQLSTYLQSVLKPVESPESIYKRQAAQPFNNDYNGPIWTSPPSYPSPWGSGAGDWGAAYEKARAFVSQLTLLEKVNLTTGTG